MRSTEYAPPPGTSAQDHRSRIRSVVRTAAAPCRTTRQGRRNIVRRWDERDVNELHENPRQMRRHLEEGPARRCALCVHAAILACIDFPKTASARGTADATVQLGNEPLGRTVEFSECASSYQGGNRLAAACFARVRGFSSRRRQMRSRLVLWSAALKGMTMPRSESMPVEERQEIRTRRPRRRGPVS